MLSKAKVPIHGWPAANHGGWDLYQGSLVLWVWSALPVPRAHLRIQTQTQCSCSIPQSFE